MRRGGQGDPILIYSFEVKPFGFVFFFLWVGNGKLYWALGEPLHAQQIIICLILNGTMCHCYLCFVFVFFLLNNQTHNAEFSRGAIGRILN